MKIKVEAVLRDIAGDHVLVPVGETVKQYNGLFSLSDVASRIWELIPECSDEDGIVDRLYSEYGGDVDRETLKGDVREFLAKLCEMGLVEL